MVRVRSGEVRVDFVGRATQFQQAARDARRSLRAAQNANRRFTQSTRLANLQTRLLTAGLVALGGVASFRTARALVNLSNRSRQLQGRLSLVSDSAAQLSSNFEEILGISNRTFTSLEDNVSIFLRIRQAADRSLISTRDLLGVIETIAQAGAVSFSPPETLRAALLQLGQGIAADALRGQELNSVLENSPAIAQALARGLDTNIGGLRQASRDGLLTAERILGAFVDQQAEVQRLFDRLPASIARSTLVLRNTLFEIFRGTDEVSQSTDRIIVLVDELTAVVQANRDEIVRGFEVLVQAATALIRVIDILAITLLAVFGIRAVQGIVGAVGSIRAGFLGMQAAIATSNAALAATAASTGVATTAAARLTPALGFLFRALGPIAIGAGAAVIAIRGLQGAIQALNTEIQTDAEAQRETIAALRDRHRELTALIERYENFRMVLLRLAVINPTLPVAIMGLLDPLLEGFTTELGRITNELGERFVAEAEVFNDHVGGALAPDTSAAEEAFAAASASVNEYIESLREALIVAQEVAFAGGLAGRFDETDPLRARQESLSASEAARTAIIREQNAIIRNGTDAEAMAATLYLQILQQRLPIYNRIASQIADIAAAERQALNDAVQADGIRAGQGVINQIRDGNEAARLGVNRQSQLGGLDQADPATAGIDCPA